MYLRTGADSHSADCWLIAWVHAHNSYVRKQYTQEELHVIPYIETSIYSTTLTS